MIAAVDPSLLGELESCKHLPCPPAIVDQIIDLSGKNDSTVETLAEIVSNDPALSAKLLRTANSPIYSRVCKTENLQQAAALFGWNGMLNLALSFSLAGSMKLKTCTGLDFNYFWKHSLACAVSSRNLGKAIKYRKYDELFLPGLLQNIGMLAIEMVKPNVYAELENKQCNHAEIQKLEISSLHADHAAIGAWLLEKWSLPPKITQLVRESHARSKPDVAEDLQEAATCVALSDFIADCICCDEANKDYKYTANILDEFLHFDMNKFLLVLGSVVEEFNEFANLFDIPVSDQALIEEIEDNAKVVLIENYR